MLNYSFKKRTYRQIGNTAGKNICTLGISSTCGKISTLKWCCVYRGSCVGAVLALGCVGRLSSPLMDLRNHYGYFLHHVVYSSLALLAVLSILLLPESKRKPLPQTLADGEQYRRPPLGRRRRDNVPLLATPNPET